MFSRLATIVSIVSLAVLAGAIPTNGPPPSTCNTGPVQCCNTVEKANHKGVAALCGLLGIALPNPEEYVGLNCSPITLIGGGGSGCRANTVCCEDNSHGNLISVGCVPVSL
ncbi:fungal hydrophobin-domain-containing protein [Daedaleopsis nitida]|nr:fungal hydrophobin-domain-containing protein [Daedaleopsis nitida]